MSHVSYEQVLSQVQALLPDDKEKLRAYLNAQIEKDNAIESARELARSLAQRDLSAEYQWIKEHREEYARQWVALKGDQLISHGANGVEVMKTAREAGHPDAFFKLILSEEERYTVF